MKNVITMIGGTVIFFSGALLGGYVLLSSKEEAVDNLREALGMGKNTENHVNNTFHECEIKGFCE